MGAKLLLSLLCVMLVVILVFNAFAISYSKTDFMSTMLTVESTIGDFAGTVNGFFNNDLFTSFFELLQTIGNGIASIEEKLNIIETISTFVERIFNQVNIKLKEYRLMVEYWLKYGVSWKLQEVAAEFSLFVRCLDNSVFWNDFELREGFLWSKFEKYRDAFLYGITNEFADEMTAMLKQNFNDYVSLTPTNTIVADYKIVGNKINANDADFWLTTVDLSLPDEYCSWLPYPERFNSYFSDIIPVFDSNFTYEYHDRECTLTGIFVQFPIGALKGVPWTSEQYGSSHYRFVINDYFACINLIFTFTAPNGQAIDISLKYGDYIGYADIFSAYPNTFCILDYVAF